MGEYDLEPIPAAQRRSGAKGRKNAVLEKTKAAAAKGLKKVKRGARLGLHWIKEKYANRKRKQTTEMQESVDRAMMYINY